MGQFIGDETGDQPWLWSLDDVLPAGFAADMNEANVFQWPIPDAHTGLLIFWATTVELENGFAIFDDDLMLLVRSADPANERRGESGFWKRAGVDDKAPVPDRYRGGDQEQCGEKLNDGALHGAITSAGPTRG